MIKIGVRNTPQMERIRSMYKVSICPECYKNGDRTTVKSAAPPPLIAHSPASAIACQTAERSYITFTTRMLLHVFFPDLLL